MARTYRYKGKKLTLQQMLARPGARSTLPDRLLSPELLAKRTANTAKRKASSVLKGPLYQPGAPMAGKDLDKAATALTDLQIKPRIGALDREGRSTETQGTAAITRQKGYYDTLAQEALKGMDRQKAISGLLQDRLRANAGDAMGRVAQAGGIVRDAAVADQAVRGQGLQTSARAAEELAAAGATTSARAHTASDLGAMQSGNWEGLGSVTKDVTGLRGAERSEQLENRMLNSLADVRSRRSEVEAGRGDEYTKNLLDLRNRSFEDQVASAGILNDRAELEFKASESSKTRSHQLRTQRLANSAREKLQQQRLAHGSAEKAKYNLTADEKQALEREKIDQRDRASRRSSRGKGGSGAPMDAPAKKTRRTIDNMVGEYESNGSVLLQKTVVGKDGSEQVKEIKFSPRGKSTKSAYNTMVRAGLPRLEAQAAAEIMTRGMLTPETVARMRRAGVRIPSRWIKGGAAAQQPRT